MGIETLSRCTLHHWVLFDAWHDWKINRSIETRVDTVYGYRVYAVATG